MASAATDFATAARISGLCATYLRQPDGRTRDVATGTETWTFTPPLTTAEETTFQDIVTMAKLSITTDLSLAEFQAIKSDLVTARNFVGIASPTAAQSNAALKSTIRILGALLRT